MRKNIKGITLVALVITIIILLILVGITISQLTGSGLFENAKLAKEKSDNAKEKEEGILEDYENEINDYLVNNRDSNTFSKVKKEVLWQTSETGTTEVQLTKNISDFSFIIVYYVLANRKWK